VIFVGYLVYTRALVEDIRDDTEALVRTYAMGVQSLASEDPAAQSAEVLFEQVIKGFRYPVIATDAFGEPLFFRNLDVGIERELPPWSEDELHRLREAARRMDRRTRPVEISGGSGRVIQLIHYQESGTITLLGYLPFIQAAGFVLVALFALWAIRYNMRVQQGQIWVAMARESAHQMATPLTSLYGWVEQLRTPAVVRTRAGHETVAAPGTPSHPSGGIVTGTAESGSRAIGNAALASGSAALGDAADAFAGLLAGEIAGAMEQDLARLTKVANRFELIGRKPKLRPLDLGDVLSELCHYFEARLPRLDHRVELALEMDDLPPIEGNRVLLEWAFENLIKNSVDALRGRGGRIGVEVDHDPGTREIEVYVRDNGSGIPRPLRKRIFKPGVTTKEGGWGVGLALARRILEDYHGGRLELVESEVGKGTTFRAILPVGNRQLEAIVARAHTS
jgi:signal transduction histidine kinase